MQTTFTYTAADSLLGAAADIQLVAGLLDRTSTECAHCHRHSNANWTEAQVAKELDAIVAKLGRLAEKLTRETPTYTPR